MGEEDVLGDWCFGRGVEFLERMDNRSRGASNRELLCDFMREHGLRVLNSTFEKLADKLVTFRELTTSITDGDFVDATKFNVLDHCLSNYKWCNSIKNIVGY
jgi:hypothetical protein